MTLLLGGAGRGMPLANAVRDLMAPKSGVLSLKIGCPFVSDSGLESLVEPLGSTPQWPAASKTWLVGVHHGITEPAALRTILSMTNSTCRIFSNGKPFSYRSLRDRPIFHAKIIALEERLGKQFQLFGAVVSSANLTRAALGDSSSSTNYEAGVDVGVLKPESRAALLAWWSSAWNQGLPLSSKLIDTYDEFRDRFLSENKILIDLVDPPSSRLLASAPKIWIDAGAMSGGSRNQIEFNRELAQFFGASAKSARMLKIRIGSKVWSDRTLAPKRTTFGVEIWRLSLPTKSMGGFTYPGQIIRLTRDVDADTFALEVATPGSLAAGQWRTEAMRTGYIGMTSGNREFGLS